MRFEAIESDFTNPMSAVAGTNLVPIWDNDAEEIVAWAKEELADALLFNLNQSTGIDNGVLIEVRNLDDGQTDINAKFDPIYRKDGPNPASHGLALRMISALDQEGITLIETEIEGRRNVIKGDWPS